MFGGNKLLGRAGFEEKIYRRFSFESQVFEYLALTGV